MKTNKYSLTVSIEELNMLRAALGHFFFITLSPYIDGDSKEFKKYKALDKKLEKLLPEKNSK